MTGACAGLLSAAGGFAADMCAPEANRPGARPKAETGRSTPSRSTHAQATHALAHSPHACGPAGLAVCTGAGACRGRADHGGRGAYAEIDTRLAIDTLRIARAARRRSPPRWTPSAAPSGMRRRCSCAVPRPSIVETDDAASGFMPGSCAPGLTPIAARMCRRARRWRCSTRPTESRSTSTPSRTFLLEALIPRVVDCTARRRIATTIAGSTCTAWAR